MNPRLRYTLSVVTLFCITLACAGDRANDSTPRSAREVQTVGELDGSTLEPFTSPRNIVELPDDQVIVNDPQDNDVWLVDFRSGTRTPFGSIGDGPGEYRSAATLIALPGDSIAIVSAGPAPRVSVLAANGTPMRSVTLEKERFSSASSSAAYAEWPPQVIATDQSGRLYGAQPRLPLGFQPLDEEQSRQVLVRFPLDGGSLDTVTTIVPIGAMSARPTSTGIEMDLPLGPFEATDAWCVLADGTVAVVDERNYGVVLFPPDEPAVSLGVISHDTVATPSGYWEAYVDSTRARLVESMRDAPSMIDGAGPPTVSVAIPSPPGAFPPVVASQRRALLCDDSNIWVPVPAASSTGQEAWDVLDRRGALVAHYALEPNMRLLAVTSRFRYVSVDLGDGLHQLNRFRPKQ